jgi:hypothetical protein
MAVVPRCLHHRPLAGIYRWLRVLRSRLNLGEHRAVTSSLVGFKPHSDSVSHLSEMSGTNGPDAYRALPHRIRVAHVSGRQLRSRR